VSEDTPVSKVGRAARNAQIAGLGSKVGARWGAHKARRVFADAERKEELDRAFELKTAEDVVKRLGNMKGAFMKLGQMASYLDQGMPEHMRKTLSALQQDAPPMSHELVVGAVRSELGAPPDEVFAEFDREPIAAASIGQVHRAITHDGRAVAVKVQYPGVDEAIKNDLSNADPLLRIMGRAFPSLDPKPLVKELTERLVEEVDYELEARNQQKFWAYYQGHPYIHVPKVIEEHSTLRVLTSELASGHRFDEVLTWSDEERNLAAETLYRFTFGSMYKLHAFNGDPHPGNYIFRPGGEVTFLDYGLVKHFDQPAIDGFMALIKAMVIDDDMARYRSEAIRQKLLAPEAEHHVSEDQLREYFGHFYEFVQADEHYTTTPEYASETVRKIFAFSEATDGIAQYTNMPPNYTIVQRINLGLLALFGELAATANWRRIAEELWPFVDGEPSTPMGRHINEVWGDGMLSDSTK
jgi:predicted unusual protein kinase regulating ubiquinone biosynthesis (AarF/ABC1/UbiB family)